MSQKLDDLDENVTEIKEGEVKERYHNNYGLIIFDELHRTGAKEWKNQVTYIDISIGDPSLKVKAELDKDKSTLANASNSPVIKIISGFNA